MTAKKPAGRHFCYCGVGHKTPAECHAAQANALRPEKPAAPPSSPLPHPLTLALVEAWRRYRALFGQPPHGTEQQIAALLDLLPKDDLIVRRVNQGPAFESLAELIVATEDYIAADRDFPTVDQWNEIVKASRAALKLAEEAK